jgi:DNA-binding transcriptional regulator YiaG
VADHQGGEEAEMSKLGDELIESMAEALAHAKGKRTGARVHKIAVKPDEIQNARKTLGLSQVQFAAAFGVSASTSLSGDCSSPAGGWDETNRP